MYTVVNAAVSYLLIFIMELKMKCFKNCWENIKNMPEHMKGAGQGVLEFSKNYPAPVIVGVVDVLGTIALYAFASHLSRLAFALATTGLAVGFLAALPMAWFYGEARKDKKEYIPMLNEEGEYVKETDGKVVIESRPYHRSAAFRYACVEYADLLRNIGGAVVEFSSSLGSTCWNNKLQIAGFIGVISTGIAAHKFAHSSFDVLLKGGVSALDVTKYAACAVTVGSALCFIYSQVAGEGKKEVGKAF